MSITYSQAVEQTITAGEQIHQIVNGTATTEVTVEDGSKVPSIRKALLDNFYFKDPIAWQVGQTEKVFNQLRQFTDGSWWYAPSATASNPISMGSTPVGNPLWKVYSFDAIGKLEPRVDEALRRSYAAAGYNLVNGSFEAGGALVKANDVLLQKSTGKAFSGPAGTVAAGTNPSSGMFVDRSGIVLASITRVVTLAEMGIHQSLNLNNIKSTSWADCVLDFGMVPLNLTAALTLNLTNVLVRGLVLRPTTYTTFKITGTNYHFAHNDLSGINAPKDYFNKTDTELPLFIALRLEGTGFSFKHNVISEYVSRQGILVANAHDFSVSNNRVINCWSYNRISTRGLFDNYGDGIYVTDSVNGFVDDNIVENSMGNPIGRIGVCVEFNCVNVKVRGNSIQGYDRGLHAELCEDDIEFKSNNIRGCNFPLVAWNCKTAKVKFIDNTITTEGIVSSNPTHAPILLYGFKAHIMSLGDYVTEYSNNSGVEFNGNTITTVDGTNTPNLIYSENALDVKFNSNKHVRKNAGYPVITISGDVQLRTYYANLFNNEFDADISLAHMDVMSVRHNRFNRLSLFFKSNSLLTRPGIENREITDNTYKSGIPSGNIMMAGEAQSRIERNTIIMQAFDYVFPYGVAHVVSDNKFVRNDPAGFDPKLVLEFSRYAQGGNAVLLSGDGNVFVDNVCKYSFTVSGSGQVYTDSHQQGAGMTRPPQFTTGGSVYDGTLAKPVFCKRRGYKTAAVWTARTAYALGAVHLLSGVVYQCIQAGTSSATIPTFGANEGNLTTDNTVVWCSRGVEALWIDATGAAV